MGIVGDRPEGGVRFDLERVVAPPEGVVCGYRGFAVTVQDKHPLALSVDASGLVTLEGEAALPKEVARRAKMLVKTAWKHARDEGTLPPLRLRRWRGD